MPTARRSTGPLDVSIKPIIDTKQSTYSDDQITSLTRQSHNSQTHPRPSSSVALTANLIFRCQLGVIATQACFVVGAVWLKSALSNIDTNAGEHFNPIVFAFAREAAAGPLLLLFAAITKTGNFRPKYSELKLFAILGTCLFFAQLMYIKGIELSGVVVATSMQPAIPVFTALFGVAMGLESPSFLKMIGIAMAVLGAVFMVLGGGTEPSHNDNNNDNTAASEGLYLGNACLLVNTIAMAVYYVLGKSVVQRHSPATVASWSYLIAATLMGCAAAVFVEPSDWHLPRSLWGPLAFWIFVCSVGGYLLVTFAIRHLPASQVAAFQCLQPVLGMVLAFTILKESPKWWDLGALGILGGLYLVSSSSKKDAESNRVAAAAVVRIKYLLGNSGSSGNFNGGKVKMDV